MTLRPTARGFPFLVLDSGRNGGRFGGDGRAPRAPYPDPRFPLPARLPALAISLALFGGCGAPPPAGAPAASAHETSILFLDGTGIPGWWLPVSGTWTTGHEGLTGLPARPDCEKSALLDTGIYLEGAYRVEIWIRSPSGSACGPGILFGSGRPEVNPWGLSVHVQGSAHVHVASVRAGRRTAIAAADVPPSASQLRRLAVDVQPRSFRVEIDGVPVTEPIALPCNEGFVALEAGAEGGTFAAFRCLRARDIARGPDAIAFAAGVAVDGFGRFIVADRNRNTVLVYSPHAVPLDAFAPPDIDLDRPETVTIGDRETILVADTGHERIVVLDWSGRFLRSIPADALGLGSAPRWLSSDQRGRAFIASPESGEVVAFDEEGVVLARTRDPFRRPEAIHVARNGTAAIADPGEGVAWIASVAPDGHLRVRDRLPMAGGVRALVIDPAGRLIVARATDITCHDPRIRGDRSWWTPALGDVDVRALALGRDGSVIAADGANHRVVRIDDPAAVLPPAVAFPAPDRAEISWRSRGDVATMVHYGTSRPLRRRALDPTPRATHRIELAGLEPATRYRFRASGAPFAIPPEIFTAELDFVTPPPAGRTAYRQILFHLRVPPGREAAARGWAEQARSFWWLATRMRLHTAFSVASDSGLAPADAVATIIIDASPSPPEFLVRPPAPSCGIGGVARAPDRGADNAALVVRAVDAMLGELARRGGHPEVPAARGDPGWPIEGDRRAADGVPPSVWLGLDGGELRLADDADGDGIPDAAADIPLDEARFGSDPSKADTDGDGASDLDEASFASGIEDGWGESASTTRTRPDPRGSDADGDGLDDRTDPDPLRAGAEILPWSRGTGPVWIPAGTIEGPGVEGALSLAWTDEGVLVAWRGSEARRIRIEAERVGSGPKVQITADLATGEATAATIPAPFADPVPRAEASGVAIERGAAAPGGFAATIRIPSVPDLGIAWDPGARYAFAVTVEDETGRMRAPGEPNRPASIRLGEPEASSTRSGGAEWRG
ncbi:MAG: hypothetical protein JXP34_23380 [Planctomycetes bacterium]|nr:hypothetical protein [Planctomycetota bacterium]